MKFRNITGIGDRPREGKYKIIYEAHYRIPSFRKEEKNPNFVHVRAGLFSFGKLEEERESIQTNRGRFYKIPEGAEKVVFVKDIVAFTKDKVPTSGIIAYSDHYGHVVFLGEK